MVQFLAKGLRGRKHGLRLPEKDFSPIYCCIGIARRPGIQLLWP